MPRNQHPTSPAGRPSRHVDPAYRGEALAVRSVVGGALMGLANLVPGVSGGTMLLAAGVYPQFINGVADVSTFRFRPKVVLMLACVVGAAVMAIAGFAAIVSGLLEHYRWAMYALFIGLTLGGVPILWRMLRPADSTVALASIVGIAIMALLALIDPERMADGAAPGAAAYALLITAGICGGAAMILPGLSGAYLLLILGQYRTIIDAIAMAVEGARGGDLSAIATAMHVFVPVGIGAAVGVVGVSNLVKMLLAKYERATLGFLLGLLLGAVIGLWPFTEPVPPQVGAVIRGEKLTTQAMVEEVDSRRWRHIAVAPTFWQVAAGLGLATVGFGISWGISHLGETSKRRKSEAARSEAC